MNETSTPKAYFVEIDESRAGQRIDNFLICELKGVPKTRVYRILRKGEVRVNKGRVGPDYKLAAGDVVRVPPIRVAEETEGPNPQLAKVRQLEDCIVYEDEGLIVLNKPSGLAVHGGSGLSFGAIEGLRALRPKAKFLELVHRLDRDTSGLLLVAKKRAILLALQEQLKDKTLRKTYWCLVKGKWPAALKDVTVALQKNELKSGERVVRVSKDGKPAHTQFRVLRRFKDCSLVEASPLTGRTHQIRVHAQYAGHPIIGDTKYGDPELNQLMAGKGIARLFLHAAALSFRLPGQPKPLELKAEPEAELLRAMEALDA
ncbi:MAG: 23S rRNA pseudouridine(955/2504/2580) synthase RluC [Gammaproteobacteria bacterium]|nr:23S rRNA pseudouridine(955/2504/2580) synthase RluC [Gammaproteobacteria bacterium]